MSSLPFRRLATTAATVLLAAAAVSCQSSPDTTEEVTVTEVDDPEQVPTVDQHHQPQQPEHHTGETTEPPQPEHHDSPEDSHPDIERSIERGDEQIDGRPPAHRRESGSSDAAAPSVADDTAVETPQVSDQETRSFAAAYIDVKDLQFEYEHRLESASDPDELDVLYHQLETETAAAIESHNLTVERFNDIGQMVETDPDLRDRIQTEIDSLTR